MPDFSNGKIYCLHCGDYFYYGSTTLPLSLRLSLHLSYAQVGRTALSEKIREVGAQNIKITLVQDFPCESSLELKRHEDIFVRNAKYNQRCLNQRHGYVSQENRIKYMKEHRSQKILCSCGKSVTNGNIARHRRSTRHLAVQNAQQP